jgi:hypothetical protein
MPTVGEHPRERKAGSANQPVDTLPRAAFRRIKFDSDPGHRMEVSPIPMSADRHPFAPQGASGYRSRFTTRLPSNHSPEGASGSPKAVRTPDQRCTLASDGLEMRRESHGLRAKPASDLPVRERFEPKMWTASCLFSAEGTVHNPLFIHMKSQP